MKYCIFYKSWGFPFKSEAMACQQNHKFMSMHAKKKGETQCALCEGNKSMSIYEMTV